MVPIEEVAESLPFESSERRDPAASAVNQVELEKVARVVEAFAKELTPVKELLLARSVEEAAEMVAELPRAKVMPLIVETPALVRSELPMDVVAVMEPLAFVLRSALVSEVMAKEVEVPKPMLELLAVRLVVEAVVK